MKKIYNNWYPTKWSGITQEEAYNHANTKSEKDCSQHLLQKCGFKYVIPTGRSITLETINKEIVVPDLLGMRKDGKEYYIEVKDKNRRLMYNDNGINKKNYELYLQTQELTNNEIPVVLLFRDDLKSLEAGGRHHNLPYERYRSWFNGEWYGNFITYLESKRKSNPITEIKGAGGQDVITFPLAHMKFASEIWEHRQTRLCTKEVI